MRATVFTQQVIRNEATANINKYKQLTYLKYKSLSFQFLTSLTDFLGILTDPVILEVFNQHLGCHIPAMVPLLHCTHFIKHHNYQILVDQSGDIFASVNIRGDNWIQNHEEIKETMEAVSLQIDFSTNIELSKKIIAKYPTKALITTSIFITHATQSFPTSSSTTILQTQTVVEQETWRQFLMLKH